MPDFDYLESVLPGFTEARAIIKAAGDSVFPLGIGPEFTEASPAVAMEVFATKGVIVTLLPAAALKGLALAWKERAKDQHSTLPLGFLLQQGVFNPALVKI